jgi:endo-1,4-beta-xylanase
LKFCWAVGALAITSICSAQSLRDAADKAGVSIGTAVRSSQFSENIYTVTLGREFNMVEPEDGLKWRTLRPNEATFDFGPGDEIVRFAQAHAMKVRGHCLVWGRDNPDWLLNGHFSASHLSDLLHEHITRVMKHYAGSVFAWDVINEALDERGRPRDSVWFNQPGIGFSGQGTAYIEQALRWAHEADPRALLFYNEAEGESINLKSDAIYAMLKDFKQRGVPIDGVGLQMHIPTLDGLIGTFGSRISANMARLAALGLQVHITELDVSVPVDSTGSARVEDLLRQADFYRTIVRACLNNPGCTAIQTWGFTDKYSWIASHSHGSRGQALLFDRQYNAKPAFAAVREELSAGRPGSH